MEETPLSFTFAVDAVVPAFDAIAATSSDAALVPDGNLIVSGSGASRTLTVTPAPNRFGATEITVTATKTIGGSAVSVSDTFTLTVSGVNDAPTLNPIANPAAILEDAGQQTIGLSGITPGPGSETGTLTVTATSDNTGLIPHPALSYGSPAASGSLSYTPVANASGSAVITVTVTDEGGGAASVSQTFTVTVTPVADTPSVTSTVTAFNTQSTTGLVIARNAADGAEVTHVRITGISGGALFQANGTTPIANGAFITIAQGSAGLRFTPAPGSSATGHFVLQASLSASDAGLGGGAVTADIGVQLGAPVITAIVPGDGMLSVAFTPPASNGGPAVTNYEYSVNDGVSWTPRVPAATTSPLAITGLSNGATYQVRLRAVNMLGAGAESVAMSGSPTSAKIDQSIGFGEIADQLFTAGSLTLVGVCDLRPAGHASPPRACARSRATSSRSSPPADAA